MFCHVIEEGSVSKAARIGYISQPAVTKQIRQLEHQYNTLLFNRKDGRLVPTNAGETLYNYAKNIVELFKQSREAVNESTGDYDLTLNIGASFTIGDYLLPNLIKKFKNIFPGYQFNLKIGNTPKIIEKLSNKDIDIALVESQFDVHSFIVETFAQDELILIVPANHHWNDEDTISLHDLVKEKMIWRERESGMRNIVEKALQEVGIRKALPTSLELGSIQSIKSAVESGLGVSILPMLTVMKELEYGTLKQITVSDLNITRSLLMVKDSIRFQKKSVNDFVKFIRKRD